MPGLPTYLVAAVKIDKANQLFKPLNLQEGNVSILRARLQANIGVISSLFPNYNPLQHLDLSKLVTER